MTLQPLSEGTEAVCVVSILLAPLAIAGLSAVNAGLARSRSAAHSVLTSLCVLSVASLVYFACGWSWQGFAGRSAHIIDIAGKPWNWIASEPLFFGGLELNGSPASLAAWLNMFSVGLAALIPLSTGADRWRLRACCVSTILLAGFTLPLFAHWAWGGGWLAQLGSNYGIGSGFLDTGGAASIHVTGGLTALAIAWILGSRRGKFAPDGMPAAMPGHNIVFTLFGCLLSLIGWTAMNTAGAILFNSLPATSIVLISINTLLSAAAAALTALIVTQIRFSKPDASLTANGWVAGLVASSAASGFVAPGWSLVIGIVAGILIPFTVGFCETSLRIDDPGGAISVHAVAGIWGLLALGIIGHFGERAPGQWLAQIVGIATLLGFVLPLTYLLNWTLNRFYPQRVDPEGERLGMDLHELGAGAYPEFVVHSDDFYQR